jgi:hypothetical protein
MAERLKRGDRVSWQTSQGRTQGKVVKVLTSDTQVEGFRVSASDHAPRYLVRSEKTGAEAAHKAEALRRL